MEKRVYLVLRIALALTFVGHGFFAFVQKPSWIPYLMAVGFSQETTLVLMQVIGVIDFGVAALAILYPHKLLFWYAFIWALATAAIRPISGEHAMEFIERASNIAIPLVLILGQKKTPHN